MHWCDHCNVPFSFNPLFEDELVEQDIQCPRCFRSVNPKVERDPITGKPIPEKKPEDALSLPKLGVKPKKGKGNP